MTSRPDWFFQGGGKANRRSLSIWRSRGRGESRDCQMSKGCPFAPRHYGKSPNSERLYATPLEKLKLTETRRTERRKLWAGGLFYASTGITRQRATRHAATTAPALPDGTNGAASRPSRVTSSSLPPTKPPWNFIGRRRIVFFRRALG